METPASFSELIRARRHELGLTQAELGRMVGRSASTVAAWEGGKTLPGEREVLEALAAVLGIGDRELEEHLDPERLSFDTTHLLEPVGEDTDVDLPTRMVVEGPPLPEPEQEPEPQPEPEPEPLRSAVEAPTERAAPSVPRPSPPRLPLSYLEDPEQVDLYRVRAAPTLIILLGLLAVTVWAVGELRQALRAVLELF